MVLGARMQAGLTLIELLVAIVVLGVVLRIAAPSFGQLIERQKAQVMIRELASGLRTARLEAVQRHRPVIVHGIGDDWSQGWRMLVDESGQGVADPANPILLERSSDGRVQLKGNAGAPGAIRFNALGAPAFAEGGFQAGTIHACAGQPRMSQARVIIARTGRTRIEQTARPARPCD